MRPAPTLGFPPPPWHLQGQAMLQLQWFQRSRAHPFIPQAMTPLAVLPGRILGGLCCASYTAASTLPYHELIVIPALVRHGLRIGAWISHIYVDHPQSVAGGRAIWGLPKQTAMFRTDGDGDMVVSRGDCALCTIPAWQAAPRRHLRGPVFAAAISQRHGRMSWFSASGTARIGIGRGRVYTPAESPLASLGFGDGLRFYLDELAIAVRAPAGAGQLAADPAG